MRTAHQRGFSLIELMIVVTIVFILALLAMPNFIDWIQNSKTRTVAESIQNGLRFAQDEAVRLSRVTLFTPTSTSWTVTYVQNSVASSADTLPTLLQTSPAGNYTGTVIAAGASNPAVIAFNSLGRVFGAATSAGPFTTPLSQSATFDVTNPRGSRTLRIQLTPFGKVHMCDPDQPAFNVSTSPNGC